MESGKTSYSVLVVEDEEPLRLLLEDIFLDEGYIVKTAENGLEALAILEKEGPCDLVISDINMPKMGGFEFLGVVEQKYPQMTRVLITAHNVDHYMEMINTHKIGNTITKGTPFNISEVALTIQQLLTKDFFGLDKHMATDCQIKCNRISTPPQIEELSNALALLYGNESNFRKLRTVFVELLTNAVFYGAKNEDGAAKDQWETDFVLGPDDVIEVYHARDHEKIGISIVDHGGKLDKETILYWMNRQITASENGLPQGIFDSHGRGLFITRKYMDRFIINVEKGVRSECIILNYFQTPPTEFKPIRINEV